MILVHPIKQYMPVLEGLEKGLPPIQKVAKNRKVALRARVSPPQVVTFKSTDVPDDGEGSDSEANEPALPSLEMLL